MSITIDIDALRAKAAAIESERDALATDNAVLRAHNLSLGDTVEKLQADVVAKQETILDLQEEVAALKGKFPVTPPTPKPPTGRRKIVLTKPWDSKDIQEDNVEIDCNGFDLIAEKIRGQKIHISNAVIYNGRSIYQSANLEVDITLDGVTLADLLRDPKGDLVRGVMTPDMRKAGWSVVTPAMTDYGVYVETKDNLWTPGATAWPIVWDRNYASITIRRSMFGSLKVQHHVRTYGGVVTTIEDSQFWNWANIGKGDKINGGPSLRLHGTENTIRRSRIGWGAAIGSEVHPYTTLNTLDDVQFNGDLRWPGNKKSLAWNKLTHNGKAI